MRYLTLRFPQVAVWEEDEVLVPGLTGRRGTILNMTLRPDGTVVELCRLETSRDRLVADLESWSRAISFEVFDVDDDGQCVFAHYRPAEELRELLRIVERHCLILELPIELNADDVTVRIAGESGVLQEAMDDIPPEVAEDVRIEQLGTYDPTIDTARSGLTDRQQTILDAAVEVGYYATPRTATIADVAEVADCAESTASEHLRKIEARVMPQLT
ncbi:helix-turn-helix domain-containing protein [Haloarchaeobius sp. DYHT-AS-18]|uniref:helix-turn-helix domain-containing protein n=1 Tax=Haloarchaeobius sp. DYHT-AS-18 TaxID=3446117 RepID=UPI003EB872D0